MSEFTLRKDQMGYRPVFLLGNEFGACPLRCRFCNVRTSKRVSSEDNIKAFNEQYTKYLRVIEGTYHPLIYNRGNVTDPKEFSRKTLNHILDIFNKDPQVKFVSINSRERFATSDVLEYLANKKLNYPIHFILGMESFSENATKILGKNTVGELRRFVGKLKDYNHKHKQAKSREKYIFGLDVNLVFLPELYLDEGEKRDENILKIKEGIKNEIKQLLAHAHQEVPIKINIHPFCQIESLPYENADLSTLISVLPELQEMIEQHNKTSNYQTHLFLGIEGSGYANEYQSQRWKAIIDKFNQTGSLSER